MEEFNVGDIVILKSGCPVMTVESKPNSIEVFCIWFDKLQSVQEKIFTKETLRRYTE